MLNARENLRGKIDAMGVSTMIAGYSTRFAGTAPATTASNNGSDVSYVFRIYVSAHLMALFLSALSHPATCIQSCQLWLSLRKFRKELVQSIFVNQAPPHPYNSGRKVVLNREQVWLMERVTVSLLVDSLTSRATESIITRVAREFQDSRSPFF